MPWIARFSQHAVLVCGLSIFSLIGSGCANHPRPISIEDKERIVESRMAISPWRIDVSLDGRPATILAVLFDGTRNHKDHVPKGGRQTVVADIHDIVERGGKLQRPARYYPGVGTAENAVFAFLDSTFGFSSALIAERACADTLSDIKAIRHQMPDADIRIVVAGFSRGAASARHFMNLLERSCAPERGSEPPQDVHFYALLFDTVATGQRKRLELSIPSAVDQAIHFVSLDERRIFFRPVLDAHPDRKRIFFVPFPGVHSDVGIAYQNGIGREYQSHVEALLYQMGLSSKSEAILAVDYGLEGGNDSRWSLELLRGIGPARSSGDNPREKFEVECAELTATRRDEWGRREAGLSLGGRGFLTSRAGHVAPAFDVFRSGDSLEVVPVGPRYEFDFWTESFLQPEIRREGRRTVLQYRVKNGAVHRFEVPRRVVDRLYRQERTRLEIGIVSRRHFTRTWWMVDGTVLGRARHARTSREHLIAR